LKLQGFIIHGNLIKIDFIKMNYTFKIVFVIFFVFISKINAQDTIQKNSKIRIGLNYGFGTQQSYPFNSKDYTYDVQFYKIQINYLLSKKTKWSFEINVEPSIYFNEHQLINKYYVQPSDGDNYLEKREEFTELKQLNEYVLNLGFLVRYDLFNDFSTYILGSVGPMYSDTDTERMHAGFAFSDIIALGISYQIKTFFLDFRYSMRHVSNANLSLPNNGYNSMNFEFGFTYQL